MRTIKHYLMVTDLANLLKYRIQEKTRLEHKTLKTICLDVSAQRYCSGYNGKKDAGKETFRSSCVLVLTELVVSGIRCTDFGKIAWSMGSQADNVYYVHPNQRANVF